MFPDFPVSLAWLILFHHEPLDQLGWSLQFRWRLAQQQTVTPSTSASESVSFHRDSLGWKTPAFENRRRAIQALVALVSRSRMATIRFSRRHYRFIFRVLLFFVASGLLLAFIVRKEDVVNSVNIEAQAAWFKDSLANLPIYAEDKRNFWQVN